MTTLNTALRTEQIKDDAIDNDKLANIAQGSIKVGGAANAPTDLDAKTDKYMLIGDGTDVTSVAISGDITISNLGAVTIGNDKVTNDMLANITQGSIKVGGASDAPTDLDAKTDGYILIGDGTDLASVEVTGDVTITNAGVTAIGATKVLDSMLNDDVATGLAGVGLSATSGVLAVDLNEVGTVAIDVANDAVAFLDNSDSDATKKTTWALLATAIAGTGITATNGVLSADAVADNIVETDILFEDESANCDGNNTTFTLASTPVTNSVQVFLRGLLQQEGSGKDYTLTGTTVEFATAPETGDILLVHYVRND